MQSFIHSLLCFLLFSAHLSAQSFVKITQDPIANAISDSRSVNIIDINGDDQEDVFISNGPSNGQDNLLYINQGNGQFSLMNNDPIVMDGGKSDGASFADIDNDGRMDAYVVTWYGDPNFLYKGVNNGQFSFDANHPLNGFGSYSETTAWGDYNGDGLVDLFITNSDGNLKNQLYRNVNGTDFQSQGSIGPTTLSRLSRNVNWIDYDQDGDVDLFVSNENNAFNELYRNNGEMFNSWAWETISGDPIVSTNGSSMSSSWGDVDNDGDFDAVIANAGFFQEQNNQLFLNDGQGNFTDASQQFDQNGGCSYSSSLIDHDNDGDLDLFITNGFCNNNLANWLYDNDGQGNFTRNDTALPNMPQVCSFGAAWGDLNNDGFLDLVIANCKNNNSAAEQNNDYYLNQGNENNWYKVKLEGTTSNRQAIGSIIRVKAAINGQSIWQIRDVNTQSGYCGQNSFTVHFGVGGATQIDSVIVDWISGKQSTLTNQDVNQTIKLSEDFANATPSVQQLASFEVHPNPSDQAIDIRLNPTGQQRSWTLMISDTTGKTWLDKKLGRVPSGQFRLDLDLPAGIYLLTLSNGQQMFTERLIRW